MPINNLNIVIENKKGSYKSFEIENDPIWKDYPLTGVTYPVNYGYITGYKSEDNVELDVFVGSGKLCGYMKIWRCDVPIETKFMVNVSKLEFNKIIEIFAKVILEHGLFINDKEFEVFINNYKK